MNVDGQRQHIDIMSVILETLDLPTSFDLVRSQLIAYIYAVRHAVQT